MIKLVTEENIQQTTLVLLFNQKGYVLLGQKKRGFGEGFRNGFGGKVEVGETLLDAAVRELSEEAHIVFDPAMLEKRGNILFEFRHIPTRYQMMHVYVGSYDGGFDETDEMRPQWRSVDDLPYDAMREDDRYWFPDVVAGKYVDTCFVFDDQNNLIV